MIAAALALVSVLTGMDGAPKPFDPAAHRVTAVVFVSAVCTISNEYHARLGGLWREFGAKPGVDFLVVYPNKTESLEQVRRHAAEMRLPFPVYRDEGNVLADRLEAGVTPMAVVAGPDGAVLYSGPIDDAVNPARVKTAYLRNAIRAALAGKRPAAAREPAYGCTIKRMR